MLTACLINCTQKPSKSVKGEWEVVNVQGFCRELGGEFSQDFTANNTRPVDIVERAYRFKINFQECGVVTITPSKEGEWMDDKTDNYIYIQDGEQLRILDAEDPLRMNETFQTEFIGKSLFLTTYDGDEYVIYELRRTKN